MVQKHNVTAISGMVMNIYKTVRSVPDCEQQFSSLLWLNSSSLEHEKTITVELPAEKVCPSIF